MNDGSKKTLANARLIKNMHKFRISTELKFNYFCYFANAISCKLSR